MFKRYLPGFIKIALWEDPNTGHISAVGDSSTKSLTVKDYFKPDEILFAAKDRYVFRLGDHQFGYGWSINFHIFGPRSFGQNEMSLNLIACTYNDFEGVSDV